ASPAMKGDIDGAATAVHGMPGLLDNAENLVARGEFSALVPQLEVRTAQRRTRHAHKHFTGADIGNLDTLDGNALAAVKHGRFHGGIGPIEYRHCYACYPFTAPSVSPDTSQR